MASFNKITKVAGLITAVTCGSAYLIRESNPARTYSTQEHVDKERDNLPSYPKQMIDYKQIPSKKLPQQKNPNYITWNEYFMSIAELAAKRSKDPVTQVGACIANEQNRIVATGYNGMPNGIDDDLVPWVKEGQYLDTKYAYVVHAELNAILNSVLTDQTGCRLYVSLFPCNECAKAIIQSGIKHVIFKSDKHKNKESTKAAKIMFKMAGVLVEQYMDGGKLKQTDQ